MKANVTTIVFDLLLVYGYALNRVKIRFVFFDFCFFA